MPALRLLLAGLLPLALSLSRTSTAQPVPRHYVAYRTATPLTLDGHLDEPAWQAAPWTDAFTDIEGDRRPAPRFHTRAKMLWDDDYFYVAAILEEPHLWATLTERDAVIFHDNDFEVFIDPDGDTHLYYEVELNALGTVWDLLLVRPYRDGGPPLDAWDIRSLRLGLHLDGTLNDPSDTDQGWTVELALPWEALREAAPGDRPPQPGATWRVNFSRVQWHTDVADGRYVKRTDPATGRPLPEDNWVWSPQGVIDMHRPERWGFVLFSDRIAGTGTTPFVPDPNERVKDALRHLHEDQRAHFRTHGRYADDLAVLGADTLRVDGLAFTPTLYVTPTLYEITAPGFDGATVHIRHDGRVWVEKP